MRKHSEMLRSNAQAQSSSGASRLNSFLDRVMLDQCAQIVSPRELGNTRITSTHERRTSAISGEPDYLTATSPGGTAKLLIRSLMSPSVSRLVSIAATGIS